MCANPNGVCSNTSLPPTAASTTAALAANQHAAHKSSLRYLTLGGGGGSLVSGTITADFCDNSALTGWSMNALKLSGVVPACIKNMTGLHTLSFAMNYLSGSLPQSMDYLTDLATVRSGALSKVVHGACGRYSSLRIISCAMLQVITARIGCLLMSDLPHVVTRYE